MSLPDPASSEPKASASRPPSPLRAPWTSYLGFGLLVAAVTGCVLFATAPSPYVVERPGPVFDTLGEVEIDEGETVPLIDIPDETTYPTSGQLDMLTVYIDGSRDRPLAWIDVATAWFDPSRTVLPVDAVYPAGQTDEEADEESAVAMDTSQQDAVAAALGELDIDYTSVFVVASVVEGSAAEGVLAAGDEILTADGATIAGVQDLRDALLAAGVGTPVDLGIRRDGAARTVTVTPTAGDDGAPVIGVYAASRYDFPIDVSIRLQNVGGPSAGMMFALAIFDKLTPGELTDGEHIAGTGTIAGDGSVGAIGGIVQKMYGAQNAGADWFLAPSANCGDVVGRIPGGLEVFSVSTLEEAIAAVEAIAEGDVAELPRCR